MNATPISIGIDLGTTNSLIACFDEGKTKIIPNALGSYLTPSVVSVLDNGEFIVGEAARERLITNPAKTAALFKRSMGTSKRISLGSHFFSSQELSALVLKSLKADAESYLGITVTDVVISVPAYFNDHQRRATIEAGRIAGLTVERLISEPTAAALAYGLHTKEEELKFLIFDLGGGTFDVSVIDLFDNLLEVRAVSGDNFLGGENFDQVIVQAFLSENDIDKNSLSPHEQAHIIKQARNLKMTLSVSVSAEMTCRIGGKDYQLKLSQSQFETLSGTLLERLRTPLKKALSDARIRTQDLDELILVGGSSKMSMIRSFAGRVFRKYPLCSINPDEVVVIGAAIAAAMKDRNEVLKENIMTDVCPFTLGTDIVHRHSHILESDIYFPIIERNTTIPCSRVERLYTAHDNQNTIRCGVYQGESRKASENILIGEMRVNVKEAPAGHEAVDIRFTYDINGILEVEITVVSTNVTTQKVFLSNGNTMTEEEVDRCLKKLSGLKIHPRENAVYRHLIEKGERIFQENLGERRLYISQVLSDFYAVLEGQNRGKIEESAVAFRKILDEWDEGGDFD